MLELLTGASQSRVSLFKKYDTYMEVTKRMKKATIIAMLAAMSFTLGACGNTATDTKDNTPKSETVAEKPDMTKKVDGVAIDMTEATKLDKTNKTDDTIIKIHFKGKNNSPDPQPLDAMLLTVKNSEGKTLDIYPSTSLGKTLAPGEKAEGDAFFVLKGDAPLTVTYENPETKSKATWTIKTIKDAS